MARVSHLFRRGLSYSARIRVPKDLVSILGKEQLVEALGTRDEAEAKRRLYPQLDEWQRMFDDLRARSVLLKSDQEHAIWDYYTERLARDELERSTFPTDEELEVAKQDMIERARAEHVDVADPISMLNATLDFRVKEDAHELSAEARKVKLRDLRKHLAKGDTALIATEVDAYLEANRLYIERGSPSWISMARAMMRAEIEALERTLERDRGDYSGVPSDPVVRPAHGPLREAAKPGEAVMEVFEQYASENPNNVKPDTLKQARRDIGLYVQYVGASYPVAKVDKKSVREWKALLLQYPVKAAETNAFKNMTIEQVVKHNKEIGKPVITSRTVNRHLSNLSAFCQWLVTHGYLEQNPVDGMSLKKETHAKTLTFTTEQMNTLFQSPLFTGCESDAQPRFIKKPGNVLIRDHRYWVPLIMLFSGARPGEIGQLAVADVREEHGHWIMHITDEGDGEKSVKNENSKRILPVHDQLIRLGFVNYRNRMKEAGEKRLFPRAERNERGQMMADFSRSFSRYLTALGIKSGRGYSQYSFRHGAADALRRAGYLDHEFKFLMGHGDTSMTGRYGMMPQGMLEKRAELINAIDYPGLSLEHLMPDQR